MKLKDYLAKKRISQADFAKKLGIKQQSISRYLQGLPPKRIIAYKIVNLTGGEVRLMDLWE